MLRVFFLLSALALLIVASTGLGPGADCECTYFWTPLALRFSSTSLSNPSFHVVWIDPRGGIPPGADGSLQRPVMDMIVLQSLTVHCNRSIIINFSPNATYYFHSTVFAPNVTFQKCVECPNLKGKPMPPPSSSSQRPLIGNIPELDRIMMDRGTSEDFRRYLHHIQHVTSQDSVLLLYLDDRLLLPHFKLPASVYFRSLVFQSLSSSVPNPIGSPIVDTPPGGIISFGYPSLLTLEDVIWMNSESQTSFVLIGSGSNLTATRCAMVSNFLDRSNPMLLHGALFRLEANSRAVFRDSLFYNNTAESVQAETAGNIQGVVISSLSRCDVNSSAFIGNRGIQHVMLADYWHTEPRSVTSSSPSPVVSRDASSTPPSVLSVEMDTLHQDERTSSDSVNQIMPVERATVSIPFTRGGAIDLMKGMGVILNSWFVNNVVWSNITQDFLALEVNMPSGGAIAVSEGGGLIIRDVHFIGNQASLGAAIHIGLSWYTDSVSPMDVVHVLRSTFESNWCDTSGCDLFANSALTINIYLKHCTFYNTTKDFGSTGPVIKGAISKAASIAVRGFSILSKQAVRIISSTFYSNNPAGLDEQVARNFPLISLENIDNVLVTDCHFHHIVLYEASILRVLKSAITRVSNSTIDHITVRGQMATIFSVALIYIRYDDSSSMYSVTSDELQPDEQRKSANRRHGDNVTLDEFENATLAESRFSSYGSYSASENDSKLRGQEFRTRGGRFGRVGGEGSDGSGSGFKSRGALLQCGSVPPPVHPVISLRHPLTVVIENLHFEKCDVIGELLKVSFVNAVRLQNVTAILQQQMLFRYSSILSTITISDVTDYVILKDVSLFQSAYPILITRAGIVEADHLVFSRSFGTPHRGRETHGALIVRSCHSLYLFNSQVFGYAPTNRMSAVSISDVRYSTYLVEVTFINNKAPQNGGALSISAFSSYTTVIIRNCTFVGNEASFGGAASINGNVVLEDSVFIGNSAFFGGALRLSGSISCLSKNEFKDNVASVYGGGAIVASGTALMNDLIFSGNSAGLSGGALALMSSSYTSIFFSDFSRNVAPDGGAIAVFRADSSTERSGHPQLHVVSSNFTSNLGISPLFRRWAVTDDLWAQSDLETWPTDLSTQKESRGGAIFAYDLNALICSGSIFRDNAARVGGAIYVSPPPKELIIASSIFYLNNATYAGGAIVIFAPQNTSSSSTSSTSSSASSSKSSSSHSRYSRKTSTSPISANFGRNFEKVSQTPNSIPHDYYGQETQSIENSIFDTNKARYGGAAWISTRGLQRLEIENTAWITNTAQFGAAIYFSGTSSSFPHASKTNFTYNTAISVGSSVFVNGPPDGNAEGVNQFCRSALDCNEEGGFSGAFWGTDRGVYATTGYLMSTTIVPNYRLPSTPRFYSYNTTAFNLSTDSVYSTMPRRISAELGNCLLVDLHHPWLFCDDIDNSTMASEDSIGGSSAELGTIEGRKRSCIHRRPSTIHMHPGNISVEFTLIDALGQFVDDGNTYSTCFSMVEDSKRLVNVVYRPGAINTDLCNVNVLIAVKSDIVDRSETLYQPRAPFISHYGGEPSSPSTSSHSPEISQKSAELFSLRLLFSLFSVATGGGGTSSRLDDLNLDSSSIQGSALNGMESVSVPPPLFSVQATFVVGLENASVGSSSSVTLEPYRFRNIPVALVPLNLTGCPRGHGLHNISSDPTWAVCAPCEEGTYNFDGDGICWLCDDPDKPYSLVTCSGSTVRPVGGVYVLPSSYDNQFWTFICPYGYCSNCSDIPSKSTSRCPFGDCAHGRDPNSCLCGTCAIGYTESLMFSICSDAMCPVGSGVQISALLFLALALALFTFLLHHIFFYYNSKVSTALFFLQVLPLLRVDLVALLLQVPALARWLCLAPSTPIERLFFQQLIPLYMVLVIVATFALQRLCSLALFAGVRLWRHLRPMFQNATPSLLLREDESIGFLQDDGNVGLEEDDDSLEVSRDAAIVPLYGVDDKPESRSTWLSGLLEKIEAEREQKEEEEEEMEMVSEWDQRRVYPFFHTSRLTRTLLGLWSLTLLPSAKLAADFFHCVPLPGRPTVWFPAPSVQCHSASFHLLRNLWVPIIIFNILSLLAFYFATMKVYTQVVMGDAANWKRNFLVHMSYFYDSFRPGRYYWYILHVAERLILPITVALSFISPGAFNFSTSLTILLGTLLQSFAWSYSDSFDNFISTFSLGTLTVVSLVRESAFQGSVIDYASPGVTLGIFCIWLLMITTYVTIEVARRILANRRKKSAEKS